ncbi:MAG: peptidoglycan recognition protein family protein [Aquimonas sp.]|nr:peptidoglycan recognition protein family protein [Aquimonas sp.]
MSVANPRRRARAARSLHAALITLALSAPALLGAQTLPAQEIPDDLKRWQLPWLQEESLISGLAAETPFYVDGDEVSALGLGLDAFFADGGVVETIDGSPLYGVALLLDGPQPEGLVWESFDGKGRLLDSGTVEITWSEGEAHVGRALLPRPAARIGLQGGKTKLHFLRAEPLTEALPKQGVLARDLPFEVEQTQAKATPLAPGVVSRAAWGARATGACGSTHSPRYLTIHHTGTPNNDSISSPARMRQMQAYHIDNRGWCDFGYHYSVGIDGRTYQGRDPARTGAHVGNHNTNNVGISVVGTFINFSPRTSQLDALTDISRWVVNRYGIQKNRTYIRGHKEWSGHTSNSCPGLLLPWLPTLVQRLSGTTPPPPPPPPAAATILESFETTVGRFNTAPTFSGSTVGISSVSSAQRSNIEARAGQWSLQLFLRDNPSSNADWFVRLLSGGGTPANNVRLQKAGGRLGAWFYTGASGVSVQFLVDDSDGTEISVARTLQPNTWTFHEVMLDNSAQWTAWAGGNGVITASQVTLDAIVLRRAQTSFDVYVYMDNVQFRVQ